MPINTETTKRVSVSLPIEEYDRLQIEIRRVRKSGRKTTASKYVANALREYWLNQDIQQLIRTNGNEINAR